MLLTIPNYIEKAKIADVPVTYKWDKAAEDFDLNYLKSNSPLKKQVYEMAWQAQLALGFGMAEWIVWLLKPQAEELKIFDYLEAAWANSIDKKYLNRDVRRNFKPPGGWKGKERGPLYYVWRCVADFIHYAETDQPFGEELIAISQMALYVLPNQMAFKKWRQLVISSLTKIYPAKMEKSLKEPVPREALDPDFDYNPDMSKKLINDFLQSLDYKKNIFLNSPDEMKKLGFEGTPYSFN